jgi:hypothetical protein
MIDKNIYMHLDVCQYIQVYIHITQISRIDIE